jgi:spore coat polysaccharide biosynthesis protein SpsF
MEALNRVPAALRILACPDDSLAAFKPLAEDAAFEIVTGPKNDVLARFCIAIRRFNIDRVIRATADNPFVFADAAEALNAEAEALNADYAGYAALPHGAGVESVNGEALLRAEREAEAPPEREHVCPYLYNHSEQFRLHRPLAPRPWQGLRARVTVDTQEDYDRADLLYQSLSRHAGGDDRYRGETINRIYQLTSAQQNQPHHSDMSHRADVLHHSDVMHRFGMSHHANVSHHDVSHHSDVLSIGTI